MSSKLTERIRRCQAVVALGAAALLCAPVAEAANERQAKQRPAKTAKASKTSRTAKPPRALLKAPVARAGEAEARLIEIYRLVGAGKARQALARAEALVRDHPNFQLAQLVYGDLLAAQAGPLRTFGDVPDATARAGAQQLAELREESQLRLRALRERPPAGAIPAQFLQLSPRIRHAIAIDASRARLYLFENGPQGPRLVGDYYVTVGRSGIDKLVEGDARTPLGVYHITSNLDPGSLRDFYGAGALPLNYPNPYDVRRGRTGSGIWLHGTPPEQFARAPKASDGCVVLANPDLLRLVRTVETRTTPVLIARSLEWVQPEVTAAARERFHQVLEAWRSAKAAGDIERLRSFYTDDFLPAGSRSAQGGSPFLKVELNRARGRDIELKDLSVLQWTDQADTMVVTFGEVPRGERSGVTKRQYWLRQGNQWKIFFEGVIG